MITLGLIDPDEWASKVMEKAKRISPEEGDRRTEEYMRTTPREQWPRFLQAAADRAQRRGITIRQLLDEDLAIMKNTPVPDDVEL